MPRLLSLPLLLGLLWGQPGPAVAPPEPGVPPELQEAWAEYERLIREHPDRPALHYNFGNLAYGARDFPKALQEYQAALRSEDRQQQARAHFNLGNSLFRAGKVSDSKAFYRKALELDPADDDARINYELATALSQQQQSEQSQSPAEQPDAEKDKPDPAGEDQTGDQPQDQREDRQADQQGGETDDQQPSPQEQAQEQPDPSPSQQQQAQSADNLEREEAEAILNALRANADNLMKRTYGPPAASVKLEKDW